MNHGSSGQGSAACERPFYCLRHCHGTSQALHIDTVDVDHVACCHYNTTHLISQRHAMSSELWGSVARPRSVKSVLKCQSSNIWNTEILIKNYGMAKIKVIQTKTKAVIWLIIRTHKMVSMYVWLATRNKHTKATDCKVGSVSYWQPMKILRQK